MQCMAGASLAVGGASGARAWLATRPGAWVTPTVLKRVTIALMAAAVIASSLFVPGAAPLAPDATSALGAGR
jgi:hypothetical protein